MMAKLIALMRLRKDIDFREARRLYEEEHVPLVMRLMPMLRDYRRNYLDPASAHIPPGQAAPDFDVVTELWFDSAQDLASFQRQMREGDEGRILRADSARFLIAGTTRTFEADEVATRRGGA